MKKLTALLLIGLLTIALLSGCATKPEETTTPNETSSTEEYNTANNDTSEEYVDPETGANLRDTEEEFTDEEGVIPEDDTEPEDDDAVIPDDEVTPTVEEGEEPTA